MEYKFTPTATNNDSILTLELLKQYIRIEHSAEDLKIQDILNQAVELFESTTGYLLRAGSLELQFSIADNVSFRKRKRYSFADRYSGDDYEYSDYYLTPLGANISTQKPSKLSFKYDNGDKERVLNQTQLTDLVPDNFFIVRDQVPLIFKIARDLTDLSNTLQFNRFVIENTITCTLAVKGIVVPSDIKGCITRIASAMFESPDLPIDYSKDSVVSGVLNHYNCTAGL